MEETTTHNCCGRRDTYALSVDGVDVTGDDMNDGVIGDLKLGDFLHSMDVDWWIINFDSHWLRMYYRHMEWNKPCPLCECRETHTL